MFQNKKKRILGMKVNLGTPTMNGCMYERSYKTIKIIMRIK